jgi:AcrR family transcriptional regulator
MSKHEEKRRIVLQAAFEVIQQVGVRKLTLDDVAERAGLAKSSLYHYFPSKKKLLRAVAQAQLDMVLAKVEQAVAEARTHEERLNAVGRAVLDHAAELAAFPGMTSSDRLAACHEVSEEAAEFKLRVRQILRELIEAGVADGVFGVEDPDLVAFVMAAGIRGLAETAMEGEIPQSMRAGVDRLGALLLDGLRRRD